MSRPGPDNEYQAMIVGAGFVLAECEAKRRMIAIQEAALSQASELGAAEVVIEHLANRTFRLLALPYADHPDYRQEWKP